MSNKPARGIKRFGEVAPLLVEQGYLPLPLNYGQKNPSVVENWPDYRFTPKDVRGKFSHKNSGTGILCGEVIGLDIDVRNADAVAEIEALAVKTLGKAPRRIGMAPKMLLVYRTNNPFVKITSREWVLKGDEPTAPKYKKHKLEVLGVGQQFVAYNLHPDTQKLYTWNGVGDPLTVKVADLITVTEAQMVGFIEQAEKIVDKYAAEPPKDAEQPDADQQPRTRRLKADNPKRCRDALSVIPNEDENYDFYAAMGHAIAGAFEADGEKDWHEWASKSSKYDEAKSRADWKGFMRQLKAGTLRSGAGSIITEAKKHGWPKSPLPTNLLFRIPLEWMTTPPPPQEWLVDKLIPMGCVTAGLAEGGTGKSFMGLQLSEGTAHGSKKWWTTGDDERVLRQGSVVYVAAEDTLEILRRRLFAIRTRWNMRMSKTLKGKALGAAIDARDAQRMKHLIFAPIVGKDIHLIDTTTGEVKQGPGVDYLIEQLRTVEHLVLVVLDPLSRLHGGDENSNAVSTALINAAERIAQTFGCAVLMLHHVSKQAASDKNASAHSGRGGSALGDGARSVLRFLPVERKEVHNKLKLLHQGVAIDLAEVEQGNVIRIVHAKNSYGPRARDIFLLRDKETGELLTLKVAADDSDPHTTMLTSLKHWLAANPMTITKDTFRDATARRKEAFGKCSKNRWLEFFQLAVEQGDLIEDPEYKGRNAEAKGHRLK